MALPIASQGLSSEYTKIASANVAEVTGQEIIDGTEYWWKTSGGDLKRMLRQADYPEDVQEHFLTWYRANVCALLGGKPRKDSPPCGIGWDGNPLEFSFELKESTKKQNVRFVVDMSSLRPVDSDSILTMKNSQQIVNELSNSQSGFDDQWYKALKQFFVYDHLSIDEQKALIEKTGQRSSVILGFDIYRKFEGANSLPVMGKVYFPPSHAASVKGLTIWQAVRTAIKGLPGIQNYPNILKSCEMINDYLSYKPRQYQMGTRYLATDLVVPAKARFKVYMRCFDTDFDSIWDYYTLGGRIPHLDEDKEKFRELMDMVSGTTYAETRSTNGMGMNKYSSTTGKLTAIYFSLSADNPYPAPKLCIYPANFAPNDQVIARGLDTWLVKHGWLDEGKSMEHQVQTSFPHRDLAERNGIFTFIGIGRKEDPTKKELSIQVYVTPELYKQPRL